MFKFEEICFLKKNQYTRSFILDPNFLVQKTILTEIFDYNTEHVPLIIHIVFNVHKPSHILSRLSAPKHYNRTSE